MKCYLPIIGAIFLLCMSTACSAIKLPSLSPSATSVPGTSRVTGVLLVKINGKSQPAKAALLYLAGTIKDSAGKDSFAALDRIHSPRTETDDHGRFVFSNVPPGNYGLILDVITNSYLLMKPGSQEPLIVEVSTGQQVDLGTLLYDSLPLSN